MNQRVVISGVGAVSPLGIGREALIEGVLSGTRPFRNFELHPPDLCRVSLYGLTEELKDEPSLSWAEKLLMAAAHEAIHMARLENATRRIGVVIGTALGIVDVIEQSFGLVENTRNPGRETQEPSLDIASFLARQLGLCGPVSTLSTACSSASYALVRAADWIRLGLVEIVIAGGVDPRSAIALSCFNRMDALDPGGPRPFDASRCGTTAAEGAGVLIVETASSALSRRVQPIAEFGGAGQSCDAFNVAIPEPSGEQVGVAMEAALSVSDCHPAELAAVYAHAPGAKLSDLLESDSIAKLTATAGRLIPVTAIKSMVGHSGSGASALALVAAAMLINRRKVFSTAGTKNIDPGCSIDVVIEQQRETHRGPVLVNSFGFGGSNSVVLLKPFGYGVPLEN